jgi:predicted TIM-barrel fold metal-dependent hydrolase
MYYPRHFSTIRGPRSAWLESTELLFEEMDSAGIRYGVLMGRASAGAGDLGAVPNADIVEAIGRWPDRFLAFLGIDLEAVDDGLAELRDYAKLPNIKGISIEPGSGKVPRWADDRALDPIYELALAHDLPVSISLSGVLSALAGHDISWADPIPVQRLARRYPDLKIIVSHAAWPYAREMVVVALTCKNIYVSPDLYSATSDMICADTYVGGANLFLADRTLFGSAYPSRDLQESVHDFLAMGWRKEIVPNILWKNAATLLRLDATPTGASPPTPQTRRSARPRATVERSPAAKSPPSKPRRR